MATYGTADDPAVHDDRVSIYGLNIPEAWEADDVATVTFEGGYVGFEPTNAADPNFCVGLQLTGWKVRVHAIVDDVAVTAREFCLNETAALPRTYEMDIPTPSSDGNHELRLYFTYAGNGENIDESLTPSSTIVQTVTVASDGSGGDGGDGGGNGGDGGDGGTDGPLGGLSGTAILALLLLAGLSQRGDDE